MTCGAVLFSLLLAGCGGHVDLVGNLPENEANEVLGALLHAGIAAKKTTLKEGTVIAVDQALVSKAIDVLRAQGLPRERRSKMGEVFKKENLISSPLEERARYLYALSQELEQTLSQIDGVVTARVHVVLPERINPNEPTIPSSASVFLKYRDGFGVDKVVSEVRGMVASSIPGLHAEKVAVALVQAVADPGASQIAWEEVFFFQVQQSSATFLRVTLILLFLCLVVAIVAAGYYSSNSDGSSFDGSGKLRRLFSRGQEV
jgi:type III secretion protein J